jgi:hypothetical protein
VSASPQREDAPEIARWKPRYVGPRGVQDGFVAGPEIGLDITLLQNVAMRAFAAYDYQFRNSNWDEGILWGGLNFGVRF